ncbi:hypothetical protein CP8484711_0851B, partial [Chlamydia psittaci 84-8471/1]
HVNFLAEVIHYFSIRRVFFVNRSTVIKNFYHNTAFKTLLSKS